MVVAATAQGVNARERRRVLNFSYERALDFTGIPSFKPPNRFEIIIFRARFCLEFPVLPNQK